MQCKKCGNVVGEGKAFCVICGEPVDNSQQMYNNGGNIYQNPQPTQQPMYNQPQQPMYNQPQQPTQNINNGFIFFP